MNTPSFLQYFENQLETAKIEAADDLFFKKASLAKQTMSDDAYNKYVNKLDQRLGSRILYLFIENDPIVNNNVGTLHKIRDYQFSLIEKYLRYTGKEVGGCPAFKSVCEEDHNEIRKIIQGC
jgi:hypothetical protein